MLPISQSSFIWLMWRKSNLNILNLENCQCEYNSFAISKITDAVLKYIIKWYHIAIRLLDANNFFPMDEIKNGELLGTYFGTIIGDASLMKGKVNKALYTNGIDQWVNVGNHRDKCLGNLSLCSKGFVMALWLNAHTRVTGRSIEIYINSGGHTMKSVGISLHQKEASLRAAFRNDTKTWFAVISDFESHRWYHVVLAWSGERGLEFYLNGCLRKTDHMGRNIRNNRDSTITDFVFGNANMDGSNAAGEMTLDEVRVWDADMDEEDVWKIYINDIRPWLLKFRHIPFGNKKEHFFVEMIQHRHIKMKRRAKKERFCGVQYCYATKWYTYDKHENKAA